MVANKRFGVGLRAAQAGDGAELARLLGQTGARLTAEDAAARLDAFRGRGAVLVATGYAGLSGLASVSWSPSLLQARLAGDLSSLVVDRDERRNGIGRLLLKAACQAARAAGCDTIDCRPPDSPEADAFCRASGFTPTGGVSSRSLRRRG